MTNSEKVLGGRFGQGGRLRQVPLMSIMKTHTFQPRFGSHLVFSSLIDDAVKQTYTLRKSDQTNKW